jgi:signal transduction histidine kinase
MDARGIAARIYDLPTAQRRAVIALLLGLTTGASWWAVVAVTPDLPVAIWFPGSAAAVITVLVSRGRRVGVALLVVVAPTVVGIAGGRSIELSIAYGIALGAEAWVVAQMLTRGRAHATMRDLNQMGWFLISSAAGVLVLVVIAGAGASFFEGVNPVLIAAALLTSHLSAIVALVPIVLVPLNERRTAPVWEPILQSFTLLVLTVVVFGPAASLAITFLLLTTLMWAASRFPPVYVAVQTICLATAASVATALDVGPFSVLIHDDVRGSLFALQLFILTHAAAGLFVAAQSAEWKATTAALAGRERDALSIAHNLSQLNAQKDDFISAVSHELRTPVTSILGFSEQVIDAHLDPETDQAARIIYRNARRLADVIEDVLELSRLSTAQASNRPTAPVDIGALLRDCVDDTMGLASTAGEVRVELQLPESPVVIQAVEQDLIRVVSNLVTNAVKFSPRGGTVTIALVEADESISVSVIDEGPGIPLDEQEAVWERFYRVHSPQHSDVPGTGLGLPIVRSLVEQRLGGEITLISDGVQGTTMVVQIPRTPPESAPAGQRTGA